MASFVRKDSEATIRRRFGVAGAAFLDVSRGEKEPLDWAYAVIPATTERAPTEGIGQMIDEVRTRVLPIVADMQRAIASVAAIAEKVNDPSGEVQAMVRDVRALTRRIEAGAACSTTTRWCARSRRACRRRTSACARRARSWPNSRPPRARRPR
jgi:phospholipid/cholesterol/gamma-HCH transport system substrate-binding protein